MKTVIILTPALEAWTNFRKLCRARGWKYQTLANRKRVPQVGKPVTIDGVEVHRLEVK